MALTKIEDFAESLKEECIHISIYIGERTESSIPYIVPKSTLCRRSEYFRKALSPNFSEGHSGTLHFPNDDEDGWKILLYYIYHRQVPPHDDNDDGLESPYFRALAHAYVLADKYGFTSLQNVAVRTFMHYLKSSSLDNALMIEIIRLLPGGCALRNVMLQEVAELVCSLGRYWEEFEQLATCEGVFVELLTYSELCSRNPANFPPHRYGDEKSEMEKYLVDEEEEE